MSRGDDGVDSLRRKFCILVQRVPQKVLTDREGGREGGKGGKNKRELKTVNEYLVCKIDMKSEGRKRKKYTGNAKRKQKKRGKRRRLKRKKKKKQEEK